MTQIVSLAQPNWAHRGTHHQADTLIVVAQIKGTFVVCESNFNK
jgi:hypothetical protein